MYGLEPRSAQLIAYLGALNPAIAGKASKLDTEAQSARCCSILIDATVGSGPELLCDLLSVKGER